MAEPIVFISRNRIKEGQGKQFRKHYEASITPTYENKPGTQAQLGYVDDALTEFTVIRVFPGPDELDQQIQGADERSKITYQLIEPVSIEIYGTPNSSTLEKMKAISGAGVSVTITPGYFGGFIR